MAIALLTADPWKIVKEMLNNKHSLTCCPPSLLFRVCPCLLHLWHMRVWKNVPLLLTYSMVQSTSWEANWFAASQEIPRISRNPKVHYRTHKRPPTVCILGQPSPVHIPTSHLQEIHPNIIHPSMPRSPQWSPSLQFPQQDPIHPLSSPICATCPAHLILLDFITLTILSEEYKSLSSSLCSLLHSPVTSSFLGPDILLSCNNSCCNRGIFWTRYLEENHLSRRTNFGHYFYKRIPEPSYLDTRQIIA